MAIAMPPDKAPIEGLSALFDASGQRRADDRAMGEFAMPALLLMERAGAEAAAAIRERFPGPRACTVLVGKGNNGGDGMVVARHLAAAGYAVRVGLAGEGPSAGAAGAMTDIVHRLKLHVAPAGEVWPEPDDLVVDALLGTGARGAPAGALGELVGRLAEHPGPVVAVDVPSGVDASTGRVEGSAVRATLTVTFGGDKVGLRVAPGRLHAGEVWVVDIGIPAAVREPATAWYATHGVLGGLPSKADGGEKYTAGAALVVGGSPGMTGAPGLATRAVLRAGGGLVVAAVPAEVQPLVAAQVPAAMVVPVAAKDGHLAEISVEGVLAQAHRVGAVAVGPGLGRSSATSAAVRQIATGLDLPLVIDADGLWHLGERPVWLADRHPHTVLTPHSGEAGRLLGIPRAEVDAGRLDAARELAETTGSIVVLKGPGTIVAAPGDVPIVNGTGGSALSTAGTGDVLTGVVAAMLARGLDPRRAATLAVALHGAAGELTGRGDGTTAGDVVEALPAARARATA